MPLFSAISLTESINYARLKFFGQRVEQVRQLAHNHIVDEFNALSSKPS
jgi:hypothetical protein